jgi:hypothetical protein
MIRRKRGPDDQANTRPYDRVVPGPADRADARILI